MAKSADQQLSPSKTLAAKVIYAALKIVKDNGGELPGREVVSQVEQQTDLDDWAKERYDPHHLASEEPLSASSLNQLLRLGTESDLLRQQVFFRLILGI